MSTNNLEKKMLQEINRLDEGLALKILKFFMKPAVKRAFSKLEKDPEFKAASDDFEKSSKRLKDALENLGNDPTDQRLRDLANKLL